jgi:hypothetical protein
LPVRLPLLPVRCYKQKQRSLLSWPNLRPRQKLPLPLLPLRLLPLNGYEQRCYKQKHRSVLSWPKIRPRQKLPLLPLQGYEQRLQGYEQRLNGYELSSKCYKQKQRSLPLLPVRLPSLLSFGQKLPLNGYEQRCYKQKHRSLLSFRQTRKRELQAKVELKATVASPPFAFASLASLAFARRRAKVARLEQRLQGVEQRLQG